MHGWTVDTSTPDTAIVVGPAPVSTTLPDVTFAFSSPMAGVTFECSLDGAAFVPCTAPQMFNNLRRRHAHVHRARAARPATSDPTPATPHVDRRRDRAGGDDHRAADEPVERLHAAFVVHLARLDRDVRVPDRCRRVRAVHVAVHVAPRSPTACTRSPCARRTRSATIGPEDTYTWTIDTMRADGDDHQRTDGLIAMANASYAFTTAGSPILTECQLDGGAFAACTSPRGYAALADGAHTFTVRVDRRRRQPGMTCGCSPSTRWRRS